MLFRSLDNLFHTPYFFTLGILPRFKLVFLPASIIFLLVVSGCATPMHRSIEAIKIGMDKSDVLDAIGSPRVNHRNSSLDEWTYIYYQDNVRFRKQFVFQQGLLIKINNLASYAPIKELPNNDEQKVISYEKKVRDYKTRQKSSGGFVDLPNEEN